MGCNKHLKMVWKMRPIHCTFIFKQWCNQTNSLRHCFQTSLNMPRPIYCTTIFKQIWTCSKHDAIKQIYCLTIFKQVWTCSKRWCIKTNLLHHYFQTRHQEKKIGKSSFWQTFPFLEPRRLAVKNSPKNLSDRLSTTNFFSTGNPFRNEVNFLP